MKKSILLLIIMFLVMLSGCNTNTDKTNKVEKNQENTTDITEEIAGYIFIDGDKLYVDEVEIIENSDKERMEELNLSDSDFPNGYYIYNPTFEADEYKITDDTEYDFVDFNLYYIDENKADGDRRYRTNNIDEFIKGSSYREELPLEQQTIPYIIELHGEDVYCIKEELLYTQ